MKIYGLYIVTISLLTINNIHISGQILQPEYVENKPSIAAIARSMGDSILIRWAPDDPVLWQLGNKYGYGIVRTKVREGDKLLFGAGRSKVTLADTVRPYKLNKIETLAEVDRYVAIVGQAIYGEDFEVSASFEKNPAQILDRNRELQNRFSFALFSADQSVSAAKVHGLWFTDKDTDRGGTYLYSVFPHIPKDIIEFDTAFVVISINDTAKLPVPYDLSATFGDKYVELSWNREYLQQYYTSYIVERSDDEGSIYIRTNESPFINILKYDHEGEYIFKVDSLPENNKLYMFRIRGITPFGETGPPCEPIAGMGIDKPDFLNPVIVRSEIINHNFALIEWEVPGYISHDIISFEISKSKYSEGPFNVITPENIDKNSRNYTDPLPYKTGFYRVASVDANGVKHYSFPAMVLMPDSIAPAMPSGFKAIVDSNGIVTFSWHSVNDEDLAGYRLYRSNYYAEGYVKINTDLIRSASFKDTLSLRTLTKKVFYRLAALDNHFNESTLSEVLVVDRPDTIPPTTTAFSKYFVTEKGIKLSWHRSPSADVREHILLRRQEGESQWNKIISINDTTCNHFDTINLDQVVYNYAIVATDSSGLESEPSRPLSIKFLGNQMEDQLTGVKATPDQDGKSIHLVWKRPVDLNYKISIYRSVNDESPVLYRTISGYEQSCEDRNVKIGNTYTYMMQIISSEGNRSSLGKGITVRL